MRIPRLFSQILVFCYLWTRTEGDLESTLARCCALGANWARQGEKCATFPTAVPEESGENQKICATAASICCLRFYRETQCETGMQAAKSGLECIIVAQPGGEYFKDCCDGCQLGITTGERGRDCEFKGFAFGHPWNKAYVECCLNTGGGTTSSLITVPPDTETLKYPELSEDDDNFIFTNRVDTDIEVPDSKNLCLLFAGQLCSQICLPTRGSYVCKCRQGFTLSVDGKTCLQAQAADRCKENNPCEHVCLDTGVSIECSCNPGYQLNADQRTCKDINECEVEQNPCGPREECVNSQGSYKCIPILVGATQASSTVDSAATSKSSECPAGYKFNAIVQTCEDIDECEEGTHTCSKSSESCRNIEGSYECRPVEGKPTCDLGYSYNDEKKSCEDIDECSIGLHLCSDREVCVNLLGAYICERKKDTNKISITTDKTTSSETPVTSTPVIGQCPEGHEYNSFFKTCTDINECINNPCKASEQCINSPGSYSCTCREGFERDLDNICRDVNECQLETHNCAGYQRCDNTVGSFTCTRVAGCGTGYTLNQNTAKCEDINECFLGKAECKPNERCMNTIGSYRCFPKINCNRGYVMNERGTLCEDVDECSDGSHECDATQLCINRQGGYVCQCPSGHRLVGSRKCIDIDECTEYYSNVCGINGKCHNTIGSYQCECNDGYKKTENGLSCNDIDECRVIPHICDHNCINTWGSHYCTCNSGFQLAKDNRTCLDVDECAEIRGRGRLCLGECVNTRGSFKCQCPSGYQLEPDQRTCRDLDECDNIGVCRGSNEICVNTRGSYRCQTISCPPNYQRDPNHRNRCKRQKHCLDSDVECRALPLTYSFNFLPLAANMSLKPTGAVDLFTLRGPLWSSTNNVNFELELEYARSDQAEVGVASEKHFILKRTSFNQVVLTLVEELQGPQEIQINLNMKLYHSGRYEGSAVAKLLILVSKYDF